jgi:hypothetical protein
MATLPDKILQLFATYHRRREKAVDEMEALYAPDVRFVDPFQDIAGRDAFIRMNRNLVRLLEEMRFDDLALVGGEPHFMLSWTSTIRAKIGPTVVAPGVSEFRTRNGLVVYQRDHWDVLSSFAGSIPGVGLIYRRITERIFG